MNAQYIRTPDQCISTCIIIIYPCDLYGRKNDAAIKYHKKPQGIDLEKYSGVMIQLCRYYYSSYSLVDVRLFVVKNLGTIRHAMI